MSPIIVRLRTTMGLSVGLLGAASMFPGTASAQAGAIGAGVTGTLTGENLYENAPIFTNSALVLPRGAWAAGADFVFHGGQDFPGQEGLGEILATAFYGVTRKLTVGIIALPLLFTTGPEGFDQTSGVGDVALDGRYQFWRSDEGRTKLLGIVRLGLPTAQEGLGSNGVVVLPGVTATHQTRNVMLNAGVSVLVPTDAADASHFEADAAVVLGVQRNLGLSLEAFGVLAEDDGDYFQIAPGARLRVGGHVFVQAAIAVTAARTMSSIADYSLLLGLAYAR